MKNGVVNAFKALLLDLRNWRASLEGLSFMKLDPVEVNELEKAFSKEELTIALKELNGNKAPRLDGFIGALWKFSCEIVKRGRLWVLLKIF